jgi:hypothetical protein
MTEGLWEKDVLNVFPDAEITTVNQDWQRVTLPEDSRWNNHELRIHGQRHRFQNQASWVQEIITTWFVEDDYWRTRITRMPNGVLIIFHEVMEETTTLGLENCKHSRERHERYVEEVLETLANLT